MLAIVAGATRHVRRDDHAIAGLMLHDILSHLNYFPNNLVPQYARGFNHRVSSQHRLNVCSANAAGSYSNESLRRKSGELFLAAARDEPNPAFAIKYGILAHKNLVEFDGKLATECYNMLLYLITNN